MSNKKQTAVDFAVEKLEKLIPSGHQIIISIILEKAKEMDKQQKIEFAEDWEKSNLDCKEDLYKETYEQ